MPFGRLLRAALLLALLAACAGKSADADGDGYGADEDCDDANSAVHPGALEVCNGFDDDCDGTADGSDAADIAVYFADTDGDGHGDHDIYVVACPPAAGFTAVGDDCDDSAPSVYPGAPEHCDGVDNDCNGAVDDDPVDLGDWYADGDGDGYGDDSTLVVTCPGPQGYVPRGGDCDDADAAVNPGAREICDALDNDCNGVVDDDADGASSWITDADGDGYGDGSTVACDAPPNAVTEGGDCDGADPAVYPGAPEHCDGTDEDCDGVADNDPVDASSWYTDRDGDTYGDVASAVPACSAPAGTIPEGGDCDDADAAVHPGATEVCDDGLDNDCDGGPGSCALTGSVELAEADAVIQHTDDGGYLPAFGTTLQTGDLDDDGADDIVLGSRGVNSLQVYRRPTGMVGNADAYVTLAATGNEQFGTSALVADLTGDGVDDLLAGAPVTTGVATYTGVVHLWPGPLTGAEAFNDGELELTGVNAYDEVGATLNAGDMDGDGEEDLLVSSYYGGYAWVLRGPITGDTDTSSAYATLAGSFSSYYFVRATSVGDLDGDGVSDVVVADSDYPFVSVFYDLGAGSVDVLSDADACLETARSSGVSDLGYAVDARGDLDGDGSSDLVVGAPSSDTPDLDAGSVFVLLAPPSGADDIEDIADVRLDGPDRYQSFGWSVDAHRDLDGNGVDDLLVGAPGDAGSSGPFGPGAIVFYGLTDTTVDFSANAALWSDKLGLAVGSGDFDGDGANDVAVSAPWDATAPDGAAYVWYGSSL